MVRVLVGLPLAAETELQQSRRGRLLPRHRAILAARSARRRVAARRSERSHPDILAEVPARGERGKSRGVHRRRDLGRRDLVAAR